MPAISWQVEVDSVSKADWSRMLDLFDDANIYQTWSYGLVRWGEKNLSHLLLKRKGEVVAMAQLRTVRPTSLKFGMAYLRWGPLCQRHGTELDSETILRMARALEHEYVTKRRLLLKIVPNAFIGSQRADAFQSAFNGFSRETPSAANSYRTFLLDLTAPLEKLRRNLDKKWRNQLTRSEKTRLKVIAGNGIDEYRRFCRMYKQMRHRKTFETTVDVEEFERIQKDLPHTHRMQILLCEQEGVPVAGLVASAMGDSAIYVLGATSDQGLNAKGSYLLQWTLVQWLKEKGVKWYDLGGIDPEVNPGVYHFKKGLSGADVTQLLPLMACDNILSSALVRASLAIQTAVRSISNLQLPNSSSRAFAGKSS